MRRCHADESEAGFAERKVICKADFEREPCSLHSDFACQDWFSVFVLKVPKRLILVFGQKAPSSFVLSEKCQSLGKDHFALVRVARGDMINARRATPKPAYFIDRYFHGHAINPCVIPGTLPKNIILTIISIWIGHRATIKSF